MRSRKGVPRFLAILSEAWRNITTGTSRVLTFVVLFALTIGTLAVVQARTVVDFMAQARAFRDSGAAIQIVSMTGAIDGAQCDALAELDGIPAAGAIRGGSALTLAVAPSRQMSAMEVSDGMSSILAWSGNGAIPAAPGVWVDEDLARELGIQSGSVLPLLDGRDADVAGTYLYPQDGRDTKLSHQILVPVAPTEPFDECWVMSWPDQRSAADVMLLPVLPQPADEGGSRPTPQIRQLNSTWGKEFNGPERFQDLPMLPLTVASACVGLVLGFVSLRLRRLEIASALHAGVAKMAVALQYIFETIAWTIVGAVPSALAAYVASSIGNTTDRLPAFVPAAIVIAVGLYCAILGAFIAVIATREKHLFKYFKNR